VLVDSAQIGQNETLDDPTRRSPCGTNRERRRP
jgi:hypothetical protein